MNPPESLPPEVPDGSRSWCVRAQPIAFICDGSSFVTSGRGQPTMTIQALAFRAAEHIVRFARSHAA